MCPSWGRRQYLIILLTHQQHTLSESAGCDAFETLFKGRENPLLNLHFDLNTQLVPQPCRRRITASRAVTLFRCATDNANSVHKPFTHTHTHALTHINTPASRSPLPRRAEPLSWLFSGRCYPFFSPPWKSVRKSRLLWRIWVTQSLAVNLNMRNYICFVFSEWDSAQDVWFKARYTLESLADLMVEYVRGEKKNKPRRLEGKLTNPTLHKQQKYSTLLWRVKRVCAYDLRAVCVW